tara:strand:- start:14 stop:868 length:855 start_codon:yes stop_codon:yes gene_type:complete
MKKKIAILGTNGFLNKNISANIDTKNFEIIKLGKKNYDLKCDYLDINQIIKTLNKYNFDSIINCIGYTNIDNLPKDRELCFLLNAKVTQNLVQGINNSKSKPFLIHFSTDHLYSTKGYSKEDNINIKNYYALTKLYSEYFAGFTKSIVLRSNFFGKSKHELKISLSDWIIKSLKNNKKIYVFNDILFNPITFDTLGKIINIILNNKKIGIFNVGSKNGFSKSQFAKILANHYNLNRKLLIPTSYKKILKNIRPKDMRMDCNKFQKYFKINIPTLEEEIKNNDLV